MAEFTNQATISYNGVIINSNIVTGEVTQVLTVAKDATIEKYNAGDILTYVISIQNSGTLDYTGLVITDDLGAYTFGERTLVPLTFTGDDVRYYINGIGQAAPAVTAGPPLVINGINVPAGGSTVVIYRARVNEYAPLGAGETIKNAAVISGGGMAESIGADKTVNADTAAKLSIIKALTPTTVVENGRLSYTFTIQNEGAAAVSAGMVISDTFAPSLSHPLTVTLDGAPWTETGNYTYNPVDGKFATVDGRVTVPAATYTKDAVTGVWSVKPGKTVLTVSGTV